ncbi:hypothetical protein [Intestinimonas sp. HCP28S3_D6]|uniref:hypothetical protein n=1 Tax=Intestinimonas sp. HCP28S3_D6 TaxID=3438942 RepID=UPI003F8C676D
MHTLVDGVAVYLAELDVVRFGGAAEGGHQQLFANLVEIADIVIVTFSTDNGLYIFKRQFDNW